MVLPIKYQLSKTRRLTARHLQLKIRWSICSETGWSVCSETRWSRYHGIRWSCSAKSPAVIIDDKEDEIANLRDLLLEKDIWVKHHHPNDLKNRPSALKPCKLVFLDLELEPDKDVINNISIIRNLFKKIIGKNFGNYGIVIWSKHADHLNEVKSRILKDQADYTVPLFVVAVDKLPYLEAGNFDTVLQDIDSVLMSDLGAKFFLYWDKLVDQGKIETIQNIYSAIPYSENAENDLKFLLYKLAQNQTGIPTKYTGNYNLENDTIKALADMLHYEIVHKHQEPLEFFGEDVQLLNFSGSEKEKKKVFAQINAKLFLDFKNLDQQHVIPGNVYEILEDQSIFKIPNAPENAINIVVEMTPPCDFAVDKKAAISKVLGGFHITEMTTSKTKEFSKDSCYKELDGLKINGIDDPQIFRFDFRYSASIKEEDLKNAAKYRLLFRFKDKLFADILQKMSSYSARLGIPMIK